MEKTNWWQVKFDEFNYEFEVFKRQSNVYDLSFAQEPYWSGLTDEVKKDITEAEEDNKETSKLMDQFIWENIDLPYNIDNEIPF